MKDKSKITYVSLTHSQTSEKVSDENDDRGLLFDIYIYLFVYLLLIS